MPRRRRPERYWLDTIDNTGIQYIHWYDEGKRRTRRRSTATRDPDKAQVELAKFVLQNDRPKEAPPEGVKLALVMTDYLAYMESKPSAEQALIASQHVTRILGSPFVADLTIDRQEHYMDSRRDEGASEATISREMSVLRASLNRAYKRHVLKTVPYIVDVEDRSPQREQRRLTIKEMAAYLNGIETYHFWMFALLSINTLARPDAIRGLTMRQVDFEDRLINLNPPGRKQTKKRRPIVPITNALLPWLEAHKGNDLVTYKGERVASIKKAHKETCRRAKIAGATPYTIRYTMAAELRRRGVPPWEVEGMLGHRMAKSTTERYAVFDPEYLGKARAAIDAYMVELTALVPRLRADNAQVRPLRKWGNGTIPLKRMVGGTGIEPVAPTMSRKVARPEIVNLQARRRTRKA